MNNFNFSGRIGRDAEVKYTAGGTAILVFAVAVDTGYGDKKETMWIDCSVFGKRAESSLVELIRKGAVVVCNGEASLNTYQTTGGEFRANVRCNINNVDIAKFADDNTTKVEEPSPSPRSAPPAASNDFDDDIPF